MTEEKELSGFNSGQKRAVLSKKDENILISAGAGSGKTKTLSYKVYRLVSKDNIRPSDLLVLTFTNKAAYEMKSRIIQQFKDHADLDSKLADEIVSGHIQTFDSFSMYLVKKYCSLLHLPDNIQIADDSILKTRKSEILDQVLSKHYREDFSRTVSSFSKFCTADDSLIKQMVFAIDDSLSGLLPKDKERFFKHYDEEYLSEEKYQLRFHEFIEKCKSDLLQRTRISYFDYLTKEDGSTVEDYVKHIAEKDYYSINRYTPFNDKGTKELIPIIFDLLETEDKSFLPKIYHLLTDDDKKDLFNGSKTRATKGYAAEHTFLYKPLVQFLKTDFKEGIIDKFGYDYEKQYQTILSFKEDIHLILDIIQEMNQKLYDYKVMTNAFTFSDIGSMAVELVTEEKYRKAGDEIRSRFKYILVDEYQDTNDIQETFLNSISKNATLFCVGDAKQSIYRFRNANVQLFMDRKKRYEDNPALGKVIDMNWNYRSSFELLANINSIFDYYMTMKHGGINYAEEIIDKDGVVTKPQSLDHDPNFIRKKAVGSFYGLGLITYETCEIGKDAEYEARCILNDIKEKVESGYQIMDGKTSRPCRYSDFAILMRVSKGFDTYQKLFDDAKIPCNIKTSDHLTQINAILLLQSLIHLISERVKYRIDPNSENRDNTRKLFLSVARSYIYGKAKGYTDEKLDELLLGEDKNAYLKDPILVKIDDFAKRHVDSPLSIIFLDLLDEFSILKDLYLVGDILSNTDKIESFYQIVLSQEQVGQGIEDFARLFRNISKYKIDLASENDFEIENAVQIMTIHASKGLEFPIVYMPFHFNSLTSIHPKLKDVSLSLKYGIMLPNYVMNEKVANMLKGQYLNSEGSDEEEVNEHVRIFYVALTRAKDALYIVGNKDPKSRGKAKEHLFEMLDYIYHIPKIKNEYFSLIKKNAMAPESVITDYLDQIDDIKRFFSEKPEIETMDLDYRNTAKKNYEEIKKKKYDALILTIGEIYLSFSKFLVEKMKNATQDEKASYLAYYLYRETEIKTKEEFLEKYPKYKTDFDTIVQENLNGIIYINSKKEEKVTDDFKVKAISYTFYSLASPFYHMEYDKNVIREFEGNIDLEERNGEKSYIPLKLDIDDTEIEFKKKSRTKERASKKVVDNPDEEVIRAMEYGTLLHSYLELLDFTTKDTSFISDKNDEEKIAKVLSLPLFKDCQNADVYHEYSYYDPDFETTGSIDLLLVYSDHIDIVDYKTKNIDDTSYDRQLNVYRRNIERIFHVKNIRMYLLSILEHRTREVKKEEF